MYRAYFKRLFDLTGSLLGLLLLSPVFLIVGLIIYLSDGLPVLFKQKRVGYGGMTFTILKFRTMRVQKKDLNGNFTPGDTGRITRFGALLRAVKFDELPQLFNVLIGDMSIVGPRPEVKKWTECYKDQWDVVLRVKPGITDRAAIEFRNEEALLVEAECPELEYRDRILPIKLVFYKSYAENVSFHEDMKIVFLTIVRLVKNNLS